MNEQSPASGEADAPLNLQPLGTPAAPISVLLVDDSAAYLDAAEELLERLPGLRVVGRARSGPEAVYLVRELKPDLVLADLVMPGMNGFEAACRMKAETPPPKVIIVSLHRDVVDRTSALDAGADGFIAKQDLLNVLPGKIRRLFGPHKDTDTGTDNP